MGTYIKNFVPPKNCADCDDDMLRTAIGCPLFADNGRHEKCPLIEAETPHGRLIDADAFAKTIKDISIRQGYDKLTLYKRLTVDDVLDSVIVELNASGFDGSKNAPTVIESEEV